MLFMVKAGHLNPPQLSKPFAAGATVLTPFTGRNFVVPNPEDPTTKNSICETISWKMTQGMVRMPCYESADQRGVNDFATML